MAKLNFETTKAAELKALNAFAARCESGSYLHELFSPKLIAWVTEQVNADFQPDLMGYVASAEQEAREHFQKRQDAESIIKTFELEQKVLNQAYLNERHANESLQTAVDHWAEAAREAGIELKEARLKLDALEAENTRLKAKLYDLTAGKA
jgi:hypothetical protein